MKLLGRIWEIISKWLGKKPVEFVETPHNDPERKKFRAVLDTIDPYDKAFFEEIDKETIEDQLAEEAAENFENYTTIEREEFMLESDKRKVYHVVPAPEKGWLVKEEKNKNPSARTDKKSDAVKRAKELAKKAKLGQVIVHKKDGRIQTEYTYGNDPKKTEG